MPGESYETLAREIKEDLNKWRGIACGHALENSNIFILPPSSLLPLLSSSLPPSFFLSLQC
jgi:hypothetical protein